MEKLGNGRDRLKEVGKVKIVMTALLVETDEHWKQVEEGFQKLGFGIPKLVGKFRTLEGKGGKGGRSDVVLEVEDKYVSKMAIHPMHLSGGFSWSDDYYGNNEVIVPDEAKKFFGKEVDKIKKKQGVTKEDFLRYEKVRLSGVTNMFAVKKVSDLAHLSESKIMEIMGNYEVFAKDYIS